MADWIYVVDDDVANLKMAGHILSKAGMKVTAFKSGAAMLRSLAEQVPDLILLDVLMPEMDGFETLRRLRAQCRASSTPPRHLSDGGGGSCHRDPRPGIGRHGLYSEAFRT